MIVSLERALSKLGFCSRAEAARKIEAGLVTLDGKIVKNPRLRVYLDAKIAVEGNAVQKQELVYFIVYKPKNVVTTRNDPQGRRTIYNRKSVGEGKSVDL